jgi:hypothetical protein
MAIHEISNILYKYMKDTVTLTDIRFGFRCEVCGHSWGIAVSDNEELLRQSQRMICLECYHRSLEENNNKGNVEDEENENTNNKIK